MKREWLINMSQQRPERVSKIRAIENMTTMIVQPLPFVDQSGDEKIWLRFAKDIWNECQPEIQAPTIVTPKLKAVPKRRRKLAAITTGDRAAAPGPKRSLTQPRQCKVKITRFQYGGPDARVAGKLRNEITLEAPCLRPTCGRHQNRRNSTFDTSSQTISSAQEQGFATPVLMPVKQIFKCQRAFNQTADLCTPCTSKTTSLEFNVFLPTHLLKHAAPATQSKTQWRTIPRQRYTANDTFLMPEAKETVQNSLHKRASGGIQRERRRLRRVTKQVARETPASGEETANGAGARRRRHRVRLVFGSKGGKESYTRLLERYLR
ncbi:hypothetical protein EJ07DRAFT_151800 [Lizonia empirigonia]|nr:hypothetical protein EJ07DRAFT_151800 [Lizonia empirigonia]